MKKVISVLLACCMLIGYSLAANVSFDEPSKEVNQKIEEAVSVSGYELFCDFMSDDIEIGYFKTPSKTGNNRFSAGDHGSINNNYFVSYTCDGVGAFLSVTHKKIGKYVFRFGVQGHAVYAADEGKLISYEEAYNRGLVTDEDIDKMYEYQEKCFREGTRSKLPFVILMYKPGDLCTDGEISIDDLAHLRSLIIKKKNTCSFAVDFGDCNKDGAADIMDIVLMRKAIINN